MVARQASRLVSFFGPGSFSFSSDMIQLHVRLDLEILGDVSIDDLLTGVQSRKEFMTSEVSG
jgi:hypothetical protein